MATTANQYYTIDNARKYTNYTITVLAYTSVGDGIKTKNFNCITHEDGKFSVVTFDKFSTNCTTIYA
jgi:hypothetical protein